MIVPADKKKRVKSWFPEKVQELTFFDARDGGVQSEADSWAKGLVRSVS